MLVQVSPATCIVGRFTGVFYVPLQLHGVEPTPNKDSAHKVNSGEENSPADPAGIRTRNLSMRNLVLLPKSYPGPRHYHYNYCNYRTLVIERLRVRVPAGAAGAFSSPESTFCADSYSVFVPPPCYRSGT